MRINLTSEAAEKIMSDAYSGPSKPLTKGMNARSANSLDWWLNSPKPEGTQSDRHLRGVEALVRIGDKAKEPLPMHSFPALFQFSDDEKRMPDKGLIKAQMKAGRLRARWRNDKLFFQLIEAADNA